MSPSSLAAREIGNDDRDTQIDLSALTARFKNVSLRTGAAASIALSHDEVEHGDGIPHAQQPEFRSDYAPGEVTYGSTTYGPVAGQHQQTPTAETGPDRIPYQSPDVSEAEVKLIRISKILRLMKEHDEKVEEHSKALEALMNPPTAAPVVDQATPMFFPDGNLAYDEELGRLQEARRKASGNSEMMRKMEGEHFTAQLFGRQTGQTVSALDARWNPEYGNRGELEARIGSIISHLDGALSQLAHLPSSYGIIRSTFQYFTSLRTALRMRGLGVYPINQLAFDERDMRITEGTEHWFDALAQSPNAVIYSYRVHLAAKLSVGILREDQMLPEGWKYEPRVRPYRLPNRHPFLGGEPDEHRTASTKFPDGVDLIGNFSEAHARDLANSIRAFQTKAMKREFSAMRKEARRDFEAPAQSSSDPNPVLSSAAEAPGTGTSRIDQDAPMPDADGGDAAAKASNRAHRPLPCLLRLMFHRVPR